MLVGQEIQEDRLAAGMEEGVEVHILVEEELPI